MRPLTYRETGKEKPKNEHPNAPNPKTYRLIFCSKCHQIADRTLVKDGKGGFRHDKC
jgi:hypothetical protein